jgi:hypothetical protein
VLKLRLDAWSEFHSAFLAAVACAFQNCLPDGKRQVLVLFLVKGGAAAWSTEK